MVEAVLQRTVRFRATHHYRRADWSAARNREAFGPVAEPHPHDWTVTVSVRGPLDAHGFVTDLVALDALLAEVVGSLEGADLNAAFVELAEGGPQPSTETLARLLWVRLSGRIPGSAMIC